MFEINDYVIYRKRLCRVKDIIVKNDIEYYLLIPIDDDSLKIEIPTSKSDNLRKPIDKEKVLEIIERMPSIKTIEITNLKLVENEYKRLLNTGDYDDLISIIKTSYLRNEERISNKKRISEIDDNYFKKAEHLIYSEFSISLGLSYDETKKYVISKVEELVK